LKQSGIKHLKLQLEIAKSYWVDTKIKYDSRISRLENVLDALSDTLKSGKNIDIKSEKPDLKQSKLDENKNEDTRIAGCEEKNGPLVVCSRIKKFFKLSNSCTFLG